jgi:DNA polymerase-1
MVCTTWATSPDRADIEHARDVGPRYAAWLGDPAVLFVGHNVAYDMAVVCAAFPELIPAVFAAYKSSRVTCTKKRQQLLDIAGGVFRGRVNGAGFWIAHNYHLDDLSRRLLGRPMQKDGWRLEYASFLDVPLERWVERARELQAAGRVERDGLLALRAQFHAAGTKAARDAFDDAHGARLKNLEAMIADVPEGCIRYPLDDATTTLGVYRAQEQHAAYLADQYRQAYADFVLYLSSAWGLRTHAPGVEALHRELAEAHADLADDLRALGFVREDGSRNMRAVKDAMIAACRDNGLPVRRTAAHETCTLGDECPEHVSLDSDACEAIAAVDPGSDLADYAEFVTLGKMLSNDVKMLEAGTTYPIHTHYDLAETGRTTSSKPNIQNLNTGRAKKHKPCDGKGCADCGGRGVKSIAQFHRTGVRQAFVPRPGKVFIQADYPQLELYTLAQCCVSWLGHSALAVALNSGLDPHLAMAATIVGITYDEAKKNKKRDDVDKARQTAKVANFGFPGGLGPKKLVMYARKSYGVTLTEDGARLLKEQWLATWPEMRDYFRRVDGLFDEGAERCSVETLFTGRKRGGATYCAACNNGYQALGVDIAKCALCLVAEAEYVGPGPLFGSRTVAFVHDEVIAEADDDPAVYDPAARELARLMVEGSRVYLPDVPLKLEKMEPTVMRMWSKDAVPVFDRQRLWPWDPDLGKALRDGKGRAIMPYGERRTEAWA